MPVEDLALLASREGRRPRPIYGAHRWFARRFGSAFRALLTAAALPEGADFWSAYYEGTNYWRGKTVLDPFVGGGTSVVEASRLGADVIGADVDTVACAITRFETRAAGTPNLWPALDRLKEEVGEELAPYYRTATADGDIREVLHYFWVQLVACGSCGETVEAHPHHQLAYEAEGGRQWAFCPCCHGVQNLPREQSELRCDGCGMTASTGSGSVRYGRLTCPSCGNRERLIDVAARTGRPPEWRLFALETLEATPTGKKSVPLSERSFRAATDEDLRLFESVERALAERARPDGSLPWVPERLIPRDDRADNRLPSYGYERYSELFNARQLLHLSLLAEAVDGLPEPEREALTLAFSDHLTTNCMMSHYAFGWRRLAPLFSVRAYRHVSRPVELNPWLDGTGRGTFPNAVRQVQRAVEFARQPKEPLIEGGFRPIRDSAAGASAEILHANSRDLSSLADESVDLVLTDPPYLDNVAYSELSDFFLPWLQLLKIAPADDEEALLGFKENSAARGRDDAAVERYGRSLAGSFSEISRVLKPEGRLVFTYQHQIPGAWHALASSMAGASLRPIQVFPLLGDGNAGSHNHEGTSKWDAVFVVVKDGCAVPPASLKLSDVQMEHVHDQYGYWTDRLSKMTEGAFREADRRNFFRACLVASALGAFPDSRGGGHAPLHVALKQPLPNSAEKKEPSDAATL